MSTRDEIEQAINDLADNAHAIGWNHRHADKTQPSVDHVMALIDAAATAPPAPGEVRIDDAMVEAGAMVIPGKWKNAVELSRLVLTAALGVAAAAPEQK